MKNYREQLKDIIDRDFGHLSRVEPLTDYSIRVSTGRPSGLHVRSDVLAQFIELVVPAMLEYETEIARLKNRNFNSNINEE